MSQLFNASDLTWQILPVSFPGTLVPLPMCPITPPLKGEETILCQDSNPIDSGKGRCR